MDFTREPVVETIITPKEGSKLVVRSSKGTAQEEYFADAIEIISFGNAFFFRSLEKPKTFLLPIADYEILEVREARMVLKHVAEEKTIKIGKAKPASQPRTKPQQVKAEEEATVIAEAQKESRTEKKRERRRHTRRRRIREEEPVSSAEQAALPVELPTPGASPAPKKSREPSETRGILSSLLPPPPTLISETIARYREGLLQERHKEEEKKESTDLLEENIPPPVPEPEKPQETKEKKRSFWDFTRELTSGGNKEES